MSNIEDLYNCANVENFVDFVNDLHPYVQSWFGGRRFSTNPELGSVSMNQIVERLSDLYKRSDKTEEVVKATLDAVEVIQDLDEEANALLEQCWWPTRLLTAIKSYIGKMFFNRESAWELVKKSVAIFESAQAKPAENIETLKEELLEVQNLPPKRAVMEEPTPKVVAETLKSNSLKTFVNCLDGKLVWLDLPNPASLKVRDLSNAATKALNVPEGYVRLIHKGELLNVKANLDRPLTDFNYKEGDWCYASVRQPALAESLDQFFDAASEDCGVFYYSALTFESYLTGLADRVRQGETAGVSDTISEFGTFIEIVKGKVEQKAFMNKGPLMLELRILESRLQAIKTLHEKKDNL